MRSVFLSLRNSFGTFGEELVIVKIAGVGRDLKIIAHIFSFCHLLTVHKGLVQFFSMPGSDDPDLGCRVVQLLYRLSKATNGGRRGFFYEKIAVMTVLKSKQDK